MSGATRFLHGAGQLSIAAGLLGATGSAGATGQPVPIIHRSPGGETAMVLGASQGASWLGWEKAHRLISAGRSFKFYGLGTTAVGSRAEKPVLSPASGSAYNVRLNGDGTMEIVVHYHYYEGGGVTAAEWKNGKLKGVLSCVDGA
jgi:hypothetical protein